MIKNSAKKYAEDFSEYACDNDPAAKARCVRSIAEQTNVIARAESRFDMRNMYPNIIIHFYTFYNGCDNARYSVCELRVKTNHPWNN